jgi:hypothetical protein
MLLSVLPDVFFEKKQYIHEPGTGQKKNSFELKKLSILNFFLQRLELVFQMLKNTSLAQVKARKFIIYFKHILLSSNYRQWIRHKL